MEKSFIYRDKSGMRLGQMVQPMRRVGIYVPGGLGAYPSSVLMNAIPAKVAGVAEIVMVSPPSSEGERLAVLAAAEIAGVDEFYRVGGAHAVAALAYGTETIKPVDKIVGPGQRLRAGRQADGLRRHRYRQDGGAERGAGDCRRPRASRMDCGRPDCAGGAWFGRRGGRAADDLGEYRESRGRGGRDLRSRALPRAQQVEAALVKRGAMVVVGDLNEAFDLANEIGPEHLELDMRNPSRWLPQGQGAGAVFLGPLTPAPLGDYLAGPNHVLPTGGAARFASPLGAYDFLKRTSIIEASMGAIAALGPSVAHLARMEGFEGHARAMELRSGGVGREGESGQRIEMKSTKSACKIKTRPQPVARLAPVKAKRSAEVERKTRETAVTVALKLDGTGRGEAKTGVPFLDHMLESFARHGFFDLKVAASGDLHIDDHHTVEDVGIVVGGRFAQALGDRAGIKRFGEATVPLDEAVCTAIVDISGRAYLGYNVPISQERVGNFQTELVHDFMKALTDEVGMNLHLNLVSGRNPHHIIEATFKALARAMDHATAREPRLSGALSTKGTLSN